MGIIETLPVTDGLVAAWFPFMRSLRDHSQYAHAITQTGTPRWRRVNGLDCVFALDPADSFRVDHSSVLDVSNLSVVAVGSIQQDYNATFCRKISSVGGDRYQFYSSNPASLAFYNGTTSSTLSGLDLTGYRSCGMSLASGQKPQFFGEGAYQGEGNVAVSLVSTDSYFYFMSSGPSPGCLAAVLVFDGVLTLSQHADFGAWGRSLVSPMLPADRRYFDIGSQVAYGNEPRPNQEDGAELVVDGDMEAAGTAAWTPRNTAVLTKVAGSPSGSGTQVLNIAGAVGDAAGQTISDVGVQYRFRGWARGDGASAYPRIVCGTQAWAGTTSDTWQYFDVVFTAVSTVVYWWITGGAGWVEFDDVSVVNTEELLSDGDMESDGVSAWTAISGATITKEAGTRTGGGGSQVLQVSVPVADTFGSASQTNLVVGSKYRVCGWAKGDGVNGIPRILLSGATVPWLGTSSSSWQQFDVVFVADATRLDLGLLGDVATIDVVQYDDVSVMRLDETMLAYDAADMLARTLPDRTANGNDGAVAGSVGNTNSPFGASLYYSGQAGAKVTTPSLSTTSSFTFETLVRVDGNGVAGYGRIVEWNSSSFLYVSNSTSLGLYLSGVTGSPWSIMADTIRYGEWTHIVLTRDQVSGDIALYTNGELTFSTTAGNEEWTTAAAWVLGNRAGSDRPFEGKIKFARQLSYAMTPAEVQARWQPIRDKLLYEQDFSLVRPTLANLTAGTIPGTDYGIESGTWAIGEDTSGTYLECVVAGVVGRKQQFELGTFDLDVLKGTAFNAVKVGIQSLARTFTTNTVYFVILPDNSISMLRQGVSTFFTTAASYVDTGVLYSFRVVRSRSTWGLYIKGGSFDEWELVDPSGGSGSNPVTDATHIDSQYLVYDLDASDRIYLDRQWFGVLDPT